MNPKDLREILEAVSDEQTGPIAYSSLSRRDVRSLVFHFLYAAESFDYQASLSSIVDNFNRGFELEVPLDSDAVRMAELVVEQREQLDKDMLPYLSNWRLERIGVCTKLVLRLAIWEMQHKIAPATVVINEAVELAKCFAEKDAYRFVNGVLDEYAKAHGFDLKESVVTDEDL